MTPSVSFIVPALNEEANIASTVQGILNVVEHRLPQFEIIVVDDGSLDGTARVVDTIAATNPRVRVLRKLIPSLGLGRLESRGVAFATLARGRPPRATTTSWASAAHSPMESAGTSSA